MTNSKLGYYFIIYLLSIARQINELSQLKTNIRWDSHLKYSSSSVLREDCETPMLNPAFAGGGGVKRPHFFRRVITPVWRGAAAPNFG